MQSAKIEMLLSDFETLRNGQQKLEQEAAELRAKLEQEKLRDPSERVQNAIAFARHCLTIVRFAIANLPPESIRSWPFQELRAIAQTIVTLPDASTDDADFAIDLLDFARECERNEIRRKTGRKSNEEVPNSELTTPAALDPHAMQLAAQDVRDRLANIMAKAQLIEQK